MERGSGARRTRSAGASVNPWTRPSTSAWGFVSAAGSSPTPASVSTSARPERRPRDDVHERAAHPLILRGGNDGSPRFSTCGLSTEEPRVAARPIAHEPCSAKRRGLRRRWGKHCFPQKIHRAGGAFCPLNQLTVRFRVEPLKLSTQSRSVLGAREKPCEEVRRVKARISALSEIASNLFSDVTTGAGG